MNLNELTIRIAEDKDFQDVIKIETEAFGKDKEANLVRDLLKDPSAKPRLSLLAFYKGQAVGHILFTRMYIEGYIDQPLIHSLAPLAVLPAFQKKGVGGALINKGIELLKDMGSEMVFVLGHMEYYPNYGFIPNASKYGYDAPYPIPEEYVNAWMLMELKRQPKRNVKMLCCDELNKEEHWRE